eukprot:Hpha_TRINITY_DN15315_c8_g9::TRINITY_DN15315_c8_g9_i1::g.91443::m.91443
MVLRDTIVEKIIKLIEDDTTAMDEGQGISSNAFESVRDKEPMNFRFYVKRLETYMACSAECFLYCLILIDRLITNSGARPDLWINSYSIHRLFLTGMVVAAKAHDDTYYSNSYYARVCGVSATELMHLEIFFLDKLQWDLFVSPEAWRMYASELEKRFGDDEGNSACWRSHGLHSNTDHTENTTVGHTATTYVSSIPSTVLLQVCSSAGNPSIASWHSTQGNVSPRTEACEEL